MSVMAQAAQSVRERMFQLLRGGEALTRQELAARLGLSMPTALQNVTELTEAGVLEECGAVDSTGGRRARKFRLRPDAGCVVGIDVGVRQVEFALLDLLGGFRTGGSAPLVFADRPDWYSRLGEALAGFLEEAGPGRVLGAGVSFPGIVDPEGAEVLRSHILGLTHMGLERFRRSIPFPAVFANDANCACLGERCPERESFVYLSLNESVGGAVLVKGRLWLGDRFQAGEAGHMLLIPGGRTCYCGKQGCADAYLSPQALRRDGWDQYLDHLAILLTNLRMLLNMDIVVGGSVGAELPPHMEALRERAAAYDRFARDVDYLFPCSRRAFACAAGAAALALDAFAASVLP